MITKVIKATALLIASMFLPWAASYEPLVDSICADATVFVRRAARFRECFWCAGLVATVVVAAPLLLPSKIFLLTGLTCVAACATVRAALRVRPLPAD